MLQALLMIVTIGISRERERAIEWCSEIDSNEWLAIHQGILLCCPSVWRETAHLKNSGRRKECGIIIVISQQRIMIITQSYPLIRPSIYSPTAYPSSVQQHHIISNDQIALPRSILHHPALNAAFSLSLHTLRFDWFALLSDQFTILFAPFHQRYSTLIAAEIMIDLHINQM